MNQQDMQHIGDGVYVGHDGYQVWLTVNSHENPELVALDPSVIARLIQYSDDHLGTKFKGG